jgi:cytochrome P450
MLILYAVRLQASDSQVRISPISLFYANVPPRRIQRVGLADRELRSYMHNMIQARREEIKNGEFSAKDDLFNALVSASMQEESEGKAGDGGLTDEELVG